MTLSLERSDPESTGRQFVDRGHVGVLMVVGIAAAVLITKGRLMHASDSTLLLAANVARAILVFGVLILARGIMVRSLTGTLGLRRTFLFGITLGVGIAVVLLSVGALTFSTGLFQERLTPGWLLSIALWALAATFVLMGWLQTRLGAAITPAAAAVIVCALWAAEKFLISRSLAVTAAYAGYYALPFMRWRTGSLGACAIALFSSQIIVDVVGRL